MIFNPMEASVSIRSLLSLSTMTVCSLKDGQVVISVKSKEDREEFFLKGINDIQNDEVAYITAMPYVRAG